MTPLVGGDLGFVEQGEADLIQAFEQAMPDEIVDQLSLFRDNGMRCLVVGNMGALHPKLSKSAAAMTPYVKVLRRLKKL